MAEAAEIGRAGEEAVVRWLQGQGWATNWDTKGPGGTDIEASKASTRLLVQVKAAVSPAAPAALSSQEETAIKSRASGPGGEAWEARVTLDTKLQPLGAIGWRKLT